MKKFKTIIVLFLLFTLYIFISAYSYVSAISDNLYNSVFRLHVIANSNSAQDQNLKYIVRDNLINYLNNKKDNFSSKEEVIEYSKEHLSDLKQIAENTIKNEGFSYPVNLEIGNFEFPTKSYGDISFPAGYYDALKVEIGTAQGKNWWCVMFPPLCFVDTTTGIVPYESKQSLQENLSTENYKIISENNKSDINVKFKIIEFFENTGLFTAKN